MKTCCVEGDFIKAGRTLCADWSLIFSSPRKLVSSSAPSILHSFIYLKIAFYSSTEREGCRFVGSGLSVLKWKILSVPQCFYSDFTAESIHPVLFVSVTIKIKVI